MFLVKKQIRPGVVVVEINDSIRIGPNIQKIEQHVDEVIRQNEKWVVFDMSRVTFIDSSGIGTLVRTLGRLKKAGGTLRLAGVKDMVQGALKITQVIRIIEVFPTAAEAAQDLPLTSNGDVPADL